MRNKTGPNVWCTRIRQSTLALFWIATVLNVAAQEPLKKISGTVSDPTGAAIQHASVEFASNGNTVRTTTDVTGSFTVFSALPYGTLSITSPGFNTVRVDISKAASEPLHIRLYPASVIERIVVTADDERIPATPASQFPLSQREIDLAGALTIDDVLRQVPGFSLFRRSGSLTGNPTAQGVSLRGVGADRHCCGNK